MIHLLGNNFCGHAIKSGDAHVATFQVTNNDPGNTTHLHHRGGTHTPFLNVQNSAPTLIWGGEGLALCTVRKVGCFGPVFPDGQGDRGNYCVPIHRTAQILAQSKNEDNDLTQAQATTSTSEKHVPHCLWAYQRQGKFVISVTLEMAAQGGGC